MFFFVALCHAFARIFYSLGLASLSACTYCYIHAHYLCMLGIPSLSACSLCNIHAHYTCYVWSSLAICLLFLLHSCWLSLYAWYSLALCLHFLIHSCSLSPYSWSSLAICFLFLSATFMLTIHVCMVFFSLSACSFCYVLAQHPWTLVFPFPFSWLLCCIVFHIPWISTVISSPFLSTLVFVFQLNRTSVTTHFIGCLLCAITIICIFVIYEPNLSVTASIHQQSLVLKTHFQ